MNEMPDILQRFVLHEGLVLSPYRCPRGRLTIGIGHNLEAHPITPEERKVLGDWAHGITKNGAFYLLRRDLNRCRSECRAALPFWNTLDDERQYAMLDMCFNLGIGGLLKFRKMLDAMAIGDYRGAAKECLASKYAKDVGKRAKRIAKTIETGEFKI
jgi:lysozyme